MSFSLYRIEISLIPPLSHVDISAISTDGGLKRLLKDRMAKHQWDDADEADFLKG